MKSVMDRVLTAGRQEGHCNLDDSLFERDRRLGTMLSNTMGTVEGSVYNIHT